MFVCFIVRSRLSNRPTSPKTQMEQEKRIRREIANSNERRRMQSINAGFQSLRTLLPHHDGEKLSKVSLLFFWLLRRGFACFLQQLPDRCREHLALPPGGIGPPPPFLLSWPFLRSLAHPRTTARLLRAARAEARKQLLLVMRRRMRSIGLFVAGSRPCEVEGVSLSPFVVQFLQFMSTS